METSIHTAATHDQIVVTSTSSDDSAACPKESREETAEAAPNEASSLPSSDQQLKMTLPAVVSEDDSKSAPRQDKATPPPPPQVSIASTETTTPPAAPVCQICGLPDSETKRLCLFQPNAFSFQTTIVHVFCGKTAAILPHINRPELEILTKAGIKKKHGKDTSVLVAMQRSRAAKVITKTNTNNNNNSEPITNTTTYYLSKEVQEHLYQIAQGATPVPVVGGTLPQPQQVAPQPMPLQVCGPPPTYAYCAPPNNATTVPIPNAITAPTLYFNDPRPPPETMAHYKSIPPPEIPPPRPAKKLKPTTTIIYKSPYQLLMERLQEKSAAVGGVGYSLVRGVSPATCETDHAQEDEALFNPNLCSPAQVDHVRILIITESRQYYMQFFINLLAHQEEEEDAIVQATLDAWDILQSKYAIQKSQICKLDMLLGFTDALKDYNAWMTTSSNDNWESMLSKLGKMWTVLLKRPNYELGMDGEFTRPGIVCLLQDFQDQVEAASLHFPFVGEE